MLFFCYQLRHLIRLFFTSLIFKSWFKIVPYFTNPNTLRTCFIFERLIKFTVLCDATPRNTSEITACVRISLSFRLPACVFQLLIHRTLYGKRIFFYPLNLGRELQSETAGLSFCTRSPCYILHNFKWCLWQLVPPEQEQRLDGFTVCTGGWWLTSFI